MAKPGETLQASLNRLGAALVVDGQCGVKTFEALNRLSIVDAIMLDFELKQEIGMDLRRASTGERGFAAPEYNFLRKSDCDVLVERACKLLGMSSYAEVFKDFLHLEAGKAVINGETCYNVLSRSGRARGLMQFQPPAWADARAKALAVNPKLDIGSYEDNVYFPANNIIAGIAYSMVAINVMENVYRVPVNGETMYLSHNQGPHFWKDLAGTNVRGQSREARRLIAKYRELLG